MTAVPEYCTLFDCLQDQSLLEGIREILAVQEPPLPDDSTSNNEDVGDFLWEKSHLDEKKAEGVPVGEVSDRMFCSACQCPFDSREEQTEHYKLDWHRFNLRQRLVGRSPATAEEFERKTGAGDMSSISGSDSEDTDSGSDRCSHGVEDPASGGTESPVKMEEPLSRLSPRVVFQNAQGKFLSVYRCVLQNKKMEEVEDLVPTLLSFSNKSVWVVLMTGGGHFAGAVFQGKEVLQHKTFHRYTVRAKRGTAQGLRDSQSRGNAPKSAGATLRRYNEAMLVKDVQDLLESWSEHLKEASVIFLRAPSYNRSIFFGGRAAPLDKNDPRVRTLPFATRRATFREVVRVHATLSTLHIYGKDTDVSSIFCPSKKAWRKKPSRPEGAADTSPAPVTAPPVAAEEGEPQEDGSTDEGDVELVEVEVTLDTLELREFEVHPSRRRRRKKKEGHRGAEVPIEPEEPREGADQNGAGHADEEERRAKRRPRRAKKTQRAEEDAGADRGEYGLLDAVYTACKTGQLDALRGLLRPPGRGDEEGRDGEDRGRPPSPAFLNREMDSSGFTLLHVASAAAQRGVVRLLMDAGCDPACRAVKGQTPYAVAPDKDTRNVFRKYMAEHPDKYDYSKTQIPGPLTEEIELKKAEKRRAQKVARKQREKEQKEERQKQEAELEEQRKFTSLSDREKRALAAEKRLAQQMVSTGTEFTNTRRCWQCGESLLGKIPFEYLHFSFCTPRCVQLHRKAKASDTKP
ncbi:tRNA endonuclease ANKZF1 [Anguilla rostrata]|uniref:tRNA endonuclease ANKZF1 n=1 Tax=Anguilla rostrata TaxID=7938 RepID=UPI0030CCE506